MKPLLWDSNEIAPFTGQPFTWDSPNPNVTWDGILEPGDPGYVPPPPIPQANTHPTSQHPSHKPTPNPQANTQPKPKKMKRNSYYPTNVPEQILWLTNFFNKLIGHAPALGVSVPECAAAVADAAGLFICWGPTSPP